MQHFLGKLQVFMDTNEVQKTCIVFFFTWDSHSTVFSIYCLECTDKKRFNVTLNVYRRSKQYSVTVRVLYRSSFEFEE